MCVSFLLHRIKMTPQPLCPQNPMSPTQLPSKHLMFYVNVNNIDALYIWSVHQQYEADTVPACQSHAPSDCHSVSPLKDKSCWCITLSQEVPSCPYAIHTFEATYFIKGHQGCPVSKDPSNAAEKWGCKVSFGCLRFLYILCSKMVKHAEWQPAETHWHVVMVVNSRHFQHLVTALDL